MAFQILGVDVLVDEDAKPWLLEVNQSPSLTTDTPLDEAIKYDMVYDTINLIGLKRKRIINSRPKLQNRYRSNIKELKEEKAEMIKAEL